MSAGRLRIGRAAAGAVLVAMTLGCSHLVVLRDPLSASEHNDLGVAYEASGELALAARQYNKSLSLEPRQSRAWVNLGNISAAQLRWRPAERSYRRALRESSTDPDALNNLAIALLRQGRGRDEARAFAEHAVALGGTRDSVYRATLREVLAGDR